MSSGESVHFVLRPNKNVERKLIAEALQAIARPFELDKYRYVGFGSFWFADFVLFHRSLAIDDMVSIERAQYAERASFNRPLKCIEVMSGDSTKVLPTLGLRNKKAIVWLDYDTDLFGPVLEDCRTVGAECAVGSIVLVTVNAHPGPLKNQRDENDKELQPLEVLRRIAPALIGGEITDGDLSVARFPKTVAKLLFSQLQHSTQKTQPGIRFVPMFNFAYKDNAPMVTIGGMLADEALETKLGGEALPQKFPFVSGETQFLIEVPPLTSREKLSLDRLLPAAVLRAEEFRGTTGFDLKNSQLQAYRTFYRHYPMFGEMQS